MSGIAGIGFLAVQAAKLYLEVAEASADMTEAEALERYLEVGKRVATANEMWESAET